MQALRLNLRGGYVLTAGEVLESQLAERAEEAAEAEADRLREQVAERGGRRLPG